MPEPDSPPGVNDVGAVVRAPDIVRVRVLGPLEVEQNDRPLHVAGMHRRRLLAFLASNVGQVVAVDAIVDALWGDDPPPTATRTIQSHVAWRRCTLMGMDLDERAERLPECTVLKAVITMKRGRAVRRHRWVVAS
jgi:hypothetical protein